MVRIALALLAGILLEIFLMTDGGVSISFLLLTMGAFLSSLIVLAWIDRVRDTQQAYRLILVDGISRNISLVSLGFILAWLHTESNYPNHFSRILHTDSSLKVVISQPPQVREKVVRALSTVTEVIDSNGTAMIAKGKLMLTFIKDSSTTKLQYGDLILIRKEIEETEPPKNPGQFNLKRYQAFRNISHQTFLLKDDWKLLAHEQGSWFFDRVYRVQHYFLEVVERYVRDKNDLAVASSLLLGYRDNMNSDVMNAYAAVGVLHVLSVSGLHVGIVFFMLNWLLKWMDDRGTNWRYGKCTFIILFIWFYAFITGLSPAVLRSAVMFSILQIGVMLVRHKNIYNTIAASIVLLLLSNPFIITDIGFQLSYLAVIGIVYLHPKISSRLTIGSSYQPKFRLHKNIFIKAGTFLRYDLKWLKWKIPDFLWQLTSVSIAAQLATTPLSIFYFHQFPNLFWIANLVVVPASNFIIYAGTALFIFSSVPYLGQIFGAFFNFFLHGLNRIVFFFQQVPYAMTEGISITSAQMLWFYVFLMLVFWYVETRKPKVLLASLVPVFFFSVIHVWREIENQQRKQALIYSIPKSKALSFISATRVQQEFDESLQLNNSSMLFNIRPHWWMSGVKNEPVQYLKTHDLGIGKLYVFEGKKILLIDSEVRRIDFEIHQKLKVDFIIFSNNAIIYIDQLQKMFHFEQLVFDSSNHKWRITKWKTECERLGLKYWDVTEEGAFVYNI